MSLVSTIRPQISPPNDAGTLHFHEWIGDGWAILFFAPEGFYAGVYHRTRLHGGTCTSNSQKRNCKSSGSA